MKWSQPHRPDPSVFINLYTVLLPEQTFWRYSHGNAETAAQLLFWRKTSWALEQCVLKSEGESDSAFKTLTSMCKKCSHGWNNLKHFYLGSTWQSSPFFLHSWKESSTILCFDQLDSSFAQPAGSAGARTCLSYVASMALFCSTVRKREGGFPQNQNIVLCALCSTVAKTKFSDYSLVFLELFAGRSLFSVFKWMIVLQSRKSISKDQSLGKWCYRFFELKTLWTFILFVSLKFICEHTKNCSRKWV